MLNSIGNLFSSKSAKSPTPAGPPVPASLPSAMNRRDTGSAPRAIYSKVFRWHAPEGQAPDRVEVVGSFTDWRTVSLMLDPVSKCWQATIQNIPGNKTHHYMVLANGEPVLDKNCDGIAPPMGPQEERFAIQTARGPRVYMLFAQAK
ncbi:MAG: hypothetical protein RJA22_849 [Verrucomicrobiota bacterium]|jgi:hypothetical protein